MIKALTIATAALAGSAMAQVPAGGTVGTTATPGTYTPAGAMPAPGTTPSGLGRAPAGAATVPGLPQPATGVTPPIGAATVGTIGDGRVGTLGPATPANPAPAPTMTTPPR